VFKLSPSGTETVLHSFTGSDGFSPVGSLIADRAGTLYGTTISGGARRGVQALAERDRDGALLLYGQRRV
jgi:hypothetical protein